MSVNNNKLVELMAAALTAKMIDQTVLDVIPAIHKAKEGPDGHPEAFTRGVMFPFVAAAGALCHHAGLNVETEIAHALGQLKEQGLV